MSLTIISQSTSFAKQIAQILLHYFPSGIPHPNKMLLTLTTKYYSSNIPIKFLNQKLQPLFPASENSPQGEQNSENIDKIDMVIFAFQRPQTMVDASKQIRQLIDRVLQKFMPESYIVCVEGANNKQFVSDLVKECNDFVMVVEINCKSILADKPVWKQSALLQQNQQNQLFQIFQLMQTTAWTNSQQVSLHTNPQKKEEKKEEKKQKQEEIQKIIDSKVENIGTQTTKIEQQEDEDKEQDEQTLQKQMIEFESLMQQMLSMKANPSTGNQRKLQAQKLIMKLANNFGI